MLSLISTLTTSSLLGALLVAAVPLPGDDDLIAQQLPTYPLDTCLVSGDALGGEDMGEPVDKIHAGKLYRFCCKGCVKEFNKQPEAFVAKVDAAVVQQQRAGYPLTTCPVSGDELDENAVAMVHGTRLVMLCCGGCVRKVGAGADKILREIDLAYIKQQRETYPLHTCVVDDEALGDDILDELHGLQLVRFCSKKCLREFGVHPRKYMIKLDANATPLRRRAAGEGE